MGEGDAQVPGLRLDGRVSVVTGASSGLGVVFAEAMAAAGSAVVLAARRLDRLEEVAGRIAGVGGEVLPVRCDVGDPDDVARLVEAAIARFDRIDVLVNNAGTAIDAGPMPERLPHELFEQTVRVNLLGTWYCCRDVGARMLAAGGGSIVNVSSVA